MRILVYDVAAEDGGGLFVLKKFCEDVVKLKHKEIEWFVLISTDSILCNESIKVLRESSVKKSYIHRMLFEWFRLPKLIKKIQPDLIVSLQNAPVRNCAARQFVYLHQSMQYCPKRFSFLKSIERTAAFRQHIICGVYKRMLPWADHIFVQTEWIKKATQEWLHLSSDNITVVPMNIDTSALPIEEYKGQISKTFFYPARAEIYKNHEIVIKACRILVRSGISDFKVIFTLTENDGVYAQRLIKESEGLPIEYIGNVEYQKIWKYYSQSMLIFPSYLETCGLPLVEARAAGCRILASDLPFSHETLDKYENAVFFQYDNAADLSEKMREMLEKPKYITPSSEKSQDEENLVEAILKKV